jgi:hypothetical protein
VWHERNEEEPGMAAENRDHSTEQSSEAPLDRRRASERFPESRPGLGATAPDSKDPDVFLDVPVVKVDEINLKVEELRARVSLQAEVLDLVKLNVGADVFIGEVDLEIKGVEAQALLKVRLDNVARILDRVLTTIDQNPDIVEQLTAGVGSAVEDVGGGAGKAAGELGKGAGDALGRVGEGAGSAVEDVGKSAGSAVEETGETARRTARTAGKTVRRAAGTAGKTAEATTRTARKDSESRTAKRPVSSGRRVVKRAKGQPSRRTAPDDRAPRS